jgi:hypothetical protein
MHNTNAQTQMHKEHRGGERERLQKPPKGINPVVTVSAAPAATTASSLSPPTKSKQKHMIIFKF